MLRWLKEPLLHFLLIGAGLFVLYGLVGGEDAAPKEQIVVTASDVERLASLFERKRQRPPTQAELDGLIEAHVRETVLYREAVALGLDRDDTIVRRRMAQKLEFLTQDLVAMAEPTEAELAAFLAANAGRFAEPARLSFAQIYFSPDRRGAATQGDAERVLAELTAVDDTAAMAGHGDPLGLQPGYLAQSPQQIARLFGPGFADALAGLAPGAWRGPVRSGYGLHLVFVRERTPGRLPALAEVRDKVRQEVLRERRQSANEALYQNLRAQYRIEIEGRADSGARAAGRRP